ncbi:MAG: MFS transporter [Pseudomonas sp.]|nr:MFS transporter [Pseudomonas sp.]
MTDRVSIPQLIDNAPINRSQWQVFGLCFLVAILDGFDTQAIAFTGPSIVQAFGLSPGALAPILTAGIVGMVMGAMALGLLGDKYGRRPIIMAAVALFGIATLATAAASHVDQILVLRFVAGLGMGGATPLVLSLAAEYGPNRHRGTIMTVVLLGLPAGAIIGAMLAARLVPVIGWQGIYAVGGVAPLLLLVVLVFALPESLHFLAKQTGPGHQRRIEHSVQKITQAAAMPGAHYFVPESAAKTQVSALFSQGLARNTLGVWVIYLFNWIAWFMLLSWLPTVLKASGLPMEQVPMGTVVVNTVFVVCAIPLSLLMAKVNTRSLLAGLFVLGIALSAGLAHFSSHWPIVFTLAGLAGLGIGGQQIVLNYMVAQAYPTALRATATGWAIAVGRTGAIVGSASGGLFLESGGPSGFYLALIVPLVIAMAGLLIIRPLAGQPDGQAALAH